MHTAELRQKNRWLGSSDSTRGRFQETAAAAALSLMLILVWSLTHSDQGFTRDAHIYAFQALARIHPALGGDLYLQNTSQDRFTIFSFLYAACIKSFGLTEAGALLLGLCAAWFLAASWQLARRLANRETAWLAVALLIVTVGQYGAYQVFHFSEDFLTARSLAEALVVTALACHYAGRRRLGLLIAVGAMFVHPLMALPGLLLLLCLWMGVRVSIIGASAGLLGVVAISAAAQSWPIAAHFFGLIDKPWLEVVRERSQFLFLQLWRARDWQANARPFICLALTAIALDDARCRRMCIAALLVGAAGLGVALVASLIGPVPILLQGQAWRWVWITSLISVLMIPATAMRLWREADVGPLCALLLVSSWTVAAFNGTALASLALAVWVVRGRINARFALLLRFATVIFAVVIVAWVAEKSWHFAPRQVGAPVEPPWLPYARLLLGLQITAAMLFSIFWVFIKRRAALWSPLLCCVALIALLTVTLPRAFALGRSRDWTPPPTQYLDWQRAIAPDENVYVANGRDSPIFTWFTLQRASYLSVDQSAGVVFSRITALEVRRRAENLRELMAPDWRLLSNNRHSALKPLTSGILIHVCRDPALGFLIAHQNVGFDPLPHLAAGPWQGWYLYNCRRVTSLAPAL